MATKTPHTRFVSLRLTESDLLDLAAQAEQAGLSRSELIRRRALNLPVLSRTDIQTADSIDKVGRLMKFLYPKNKAWATAEERRKYWRTIEDLQRTSQVLRGNPEEEKCSPK
ncbi:putative uncharacterized protein [Burkholderiales bacterium GJ-E10]|nr:putative uncharacterized protein [Burkholderiales bacterium GJ-E10]